MLDQPLRQPINISFSAYAPLVMSVRIGQPNALLAAHGVRLVVHDSTIALAKSIPADEPKILILQRMMADKEKWPEYLGRIIDKGWIVVHEVDDDPSLTGLKTNNTKWEQSIGWKGYSYCHAIQTSTDNLADTLRAYNPEVKVFPNHLYRLPELYFRKDDNIRVLFGALNRAEDWSPLMPGFNRIAKQNPKVQFIVIQDQAFFDALETDNKIFNTLAEYEDYQKILSACDIALMPLNDTKFKRCKSDIKFVEAAGAGLACLASPTVYAATIKDGETGLIANSVEEWESKLELLVTDQELRERVSKAALNYVVQERMLGNHIHKRIEWYQWLWDNRTELNEALFDRHPELRP